MRWVAGLAFGTGDWLGKPLRTIGHYRPAPSRVDPLVGLRHSAMAVFRCGPENAMRHIVIFSVTLATLLTLAAPARAGMVEDCVQSHDRDVQIVGCTAAIRSGQWQGKELAWAYNHRGAAYRILGDYSRAIEDYDQALRLDPNLAQAYQNRAIALDNLNPSGEGSNGKATGDYKVAVIIGVVALGLFLVLLAFGVFVHSLAVAIYMFGWAAESGFIGVALYIILWVVAMPVMLTICIIGGVIRLLSKAEF